MDTKVKPSVRCWLFYPPELDGGESLNFWIQYCLRYKAEHVLKIVLPLLDGFGEKDDGQQRRSRGERE